MLFPTGFVAGDQLLCHLLNAEALGSQQNDEVVEHVGSLVKQAVIRAVDGLDAGLQRFLTHFLGHAVHAVAEEGGGVGALRHLLTAFVDEILQLAQEHEGRSLVHIAPAGIRAGMADGADGIHLHQQGVVVAIHADVHQLQEVAAGLALHPQLLPGTAEKGDFARFQRLLVGLAVHVTKHQHLGRAGILNNGRHQAAALLEIDVHKLLKSCCGFSIAHFGVFVTLFSVTRLSRPPEHVPWRRPWHRYLPPNERWR